MTRVDAQTAHVLHTRPYRDSSLLVEFITPDYGRVSGVVRGVRSKGKTAKQRRSMMQPLVPLLISWMGKSDLKTITSFESSAAALPLQGRRLFSAIYVNELMVRLMPHYDGNAQVYSLYQWVLQALLLESLIEVPLRQFELRLLQFLGYGIDLDYEMGSGAEIVAGRRYFLEPDRGFNWLPPAAVTASAEPRLFNGEDLIAIKQEVFDPQLRRVAKRLCRLALQPHLGVKPLKSRELFI